MYVFLVFQKMISESARADDDLVVCCLQRCNKDLVAEYSSLEVVSLPEVEDRLYLLLITDSHADGAVGVILVVENMEGG